jgi:hypothetical protein
LEGVSVMIFQSASTLFSLTFFESTGVRGLSNPRLTFGRSFGDDFPVGTDSVFVDFFWVNMGYGQFRIHASPFGSCFVYFFLVNRACERF